MKRKSKMAKGGRQTARAVLFELLNHVNDTRAYSEGLEAGQKRVISGEQAENPYFKTSFSSAWETGYREGQAHYGN